MSSFQNLQAIAAARAKAQEEKLAAERTEKLRQEAERKAAKEAAERQRVQRERQAFVAREQRKKQEAEAAKQRAEEEKKARELAIKRRQEEEVARLQSTGKQGKNGAAAKAGNGSGVAGSSSSPGKGAVDMKAFASASRKALARAGASTSSKNGKSREVEDEDGFLRSREPSYLTREEKRARRERAMFGGDGAKGGSGSRKGKANGLIAPSRGDHLPGPNTHAELVALGQHKRDKRTIDEIERELRAAKMAARSVSSDKMQVREAARQEAELEAMLRRKRAMENKKRLEGGGVAPGDTIQLRPHSASTPAEKSSLSSKPSERPAAPQKTALGLTAADYLPGAPVRASLAQPKPKKSSNSLRADRLTHDADTSKGASGSTQSLASQTEEAPRKRETARDKFLREEAERKARQKLSAASQRFNEDDDDEDDIGSEGDEMDEYETEEGEEEASEGGDFRAEIWKLFGRDRKAYIAHRDDDSDSDMEADMASVAREEARSSRLARLEDEREEREEARRLAEKQARKKARLGS